MSVTTEAHDAWCPPTFSPSRLGRRWLALWIIQVESQSTFRSSARRQARRRGAGASARRSWRSSAPALAETFSGSSIATHPARTSGHGHENNLILLELPWASCRIFLLAHPHGLIRLCGAQDWT